MLNLIPKLTPEEIKQLRECADQRGGMNLLARETGVHRNTVRSVMYSGICSEDVAKRIKKYLKKQSATI